MGHTGISHFEGGLIFFKVEAKFESISLYKRLPKVKNLPAMQKTWVQSLGWEDSWEKEIATHCSISAWKISWTEEPTGL